MAFASIVRGAALCKGGAIKTSFYAVTGATTLSLSVSTSDSQPSSVDWGDGVRVNCASGATVDHTYGAPFTGAVAITTRSGTLVRWSSGSTGWSFNLSALPVGVGVVGISGSNTVTGNLSSIPNATIVSIYGSNTVTGNLSSIPNATIVAIYGSNTVSDYTARSWPSSMRHVAVVPVSPGGLSAPEVDQLLINLAAYVTTWVMEKTVRLTGTNAAPTAASASAITTLQGRGVTVVTN